MRLEKILLTHAHIDHAGGTAELARSLKLPIVGPASRRPVLDRRAAGAGAHVRLPATARRSTPDQWLDEGDRVQVGDVEFEVRHCPGHTPGHVVFYRLPTSAGVRRRRAVRRLDRPDGLPGRRLRHADPRDPREAASRSATTCASCRGTGRCRRSARSGAAIRSSATGGSRDIRLCRGGNV